MLSLYFRELIRSHLQTIAPKLSASRISIFALEDLPQKSKVTKWRLLKMRNQNLQSRAACSNYAAAKAKSLPIKKFEFF